MLLQALVACAGVTLAAVAASLQIHFTTGTVTAEGDLDVRGTLAVSKDAPVGFRSIRLAFDLGTDASDDQIQTLLRLTERYCVVYQTLAHPATMTVSASHATYLTTQNDGQHRSGMRSHGATGPQHRLDEGDGCG
jgi:uncharacterized OsmC-like protein